MILSISTVVLASSRTSEPLLLFPNYYFVSSHIREPGFRKKHQNLLRSPSLLRIIVATIIIIQHVSHKKAYSFPSTATLLSEPFCRGYPIPTTHPSAPSTLITLCTLLTRPKTLLPTLPYQTTPAIMTLSSSIFLPSLPRSLDLRSMERETSHSWR
ncbi:uncharacterized protein LY89DRAFT_79432 [Mollisia scopiformis]|uniref:Uncharacterized protein n=1 Tax=Mollisia scopiformis TaxID=149040 RepID=A0A194X817_MOLSC|nr:uncharacterized protein LY89DRAFT_79432 [Mollisia scopiformis]KUJ16306.1 hypothetical protein LY89DRAFT_79432 [Mollisia scopiformis]